MEWDANTYIQHSDYQFRIGQAAIAQLTPRDSEYVLEIGCGAGQLTVEIAKQIPNGRILATDISQNMVEKARETVALNGVSNVQFMCIDACEIQYDREFDAIFSNATIHLIYHKKRLFEKMYAALKPGGRVMLTAGFTPLEGTRKGLERAQFININLKMQDFEGNQNDLMCVAQSATQNLIAGASSPEAREKLRENIKQNFWKSLEGFGIRVESSNNKKVFKQPILFIAAEKRS
jgi:ubiquinone/menaquinone biosynthesis C-methylase UbiE